MSWNSPDRGDSFHSSSSSVASDSKLVDFVAHKEEVTCIKFSQKSLRLLATGGADAKVNIWNNWDRSDGSFFLCMYVCMYVCI